MKQIRGILAMLLFITLAGFMSTSAHAASAYDSTVRITNTLQIVSPDGTDAADLTYNWRNFVSSAYSSGGSICASSYEVADFQEALNSGYVAISLRESTTDSAQSVWLFWDSETVAGGFDSSYFTTYGSATMMYPPSVTGGADISISNNGDITVRCVDDTGWYTSPNTAIFASSGATPSNGGDWKVFMSEYPISYPNGYEGALIPSAPPVAEYVALGDSFASGEGNSSYEADSVTRSCNRSTVAWPRVLQMELEFGTTKFAACSGAVVSDVLTEGPEGPQIDALSTGTQTVTITIGGNDAGFQEYLVSCVITSCGPSTAPYEAVMDILESTAFQTNLEFAYEEILDEAGNADVYVVDYPYLTSANATSCNFVDLSGARDIQTELNSVIEAAVANVQAANSDYLARLNYVPTNYTGSPFSGQHLCNGGTSDFEITTFHPNLMGHAHYAEVVADAMN